MFCKNTLTNLSAKYVQAKTYVFLMFKIKQNLQFCIIMSEDDFLCVKKNRHKSIRLLRFLKYLKTYFLL